MRLHIGFSTLYKINWKKNVPYIRQSGVHVFAKRSVSTIMACEEIGLSVDSNQDVLIK